MNPRTLILGAVVLTVGILIGVFGGRLMGGGEATSGSGEPEILYWVAPMDPNFRRDEPGKSPMGMDLVPVYAGDEPADTSSVTISPSVENNIGVRTAVAERSRFAEDLNTVGYVRPVDDLTSVVDVRAQGWIEDLRVAAVGDVVEAGDLLFRMYSPEIVTAQTEYLQAVRVGRSGLVSAARSRLQALGVGAAQVEAIARRGEAQRLIEIYAPRSGVVLEMNVREGAHVHPSMEVMTIADLGEVWVIADLFEDDAAVITSGQDVHMRSPAQPGRMWHGQVEYVYPTVDATSRSIPVRMRFANADGALRPEAFVNLRIEVAPRDGVLSVPAEAVIRTGQSERVILALGGGRYQPARVETGPEAQGRVEVLSGLAAGERVVVSSQFLIDSEANLQGASLRMSPAEEEAPPPEVVYGSGVVDAIMAGHGMIDLTHEPIPALDWPVMSMSFFALDETVSLDGLSVGQTVDFSLRQNADGQWRIASISEAGAGSEPLVEGRGRVVTLMSEFGMVEIDHERIEAINMPAMSMVYELDDGVSLDGLSVGDEVVFSIEEEAPGQWQLTGYSIRSDAGETP
ncbi:MAG: efflux RND transporter periplasmic adaptor subunit [Pseudomonadota bacterium]|nr:efflux RND transporter periplasmic adaptor subunit [Pseudomonadota bacterium]